MVHGTLVLQTKSNLLRENMIGFQEFFFFNNITVTKLTFEGKHEQKH